MPPTVQRSLLSSDKSFVYRMEDLRFRRDVQQMAVVLFLGVVVASTTAEQTLLSNFNEAKARMNERDASCISVAAELSPCLSVCSPLSRLTTMEEADCCTTLLLFKEVDCYWYFPHFPS